MQNAPSIIEDILTGRRRAHSGDDRDTTFVLMTEHHWRWQCYDPRACVARQDAEAAWLETRISITEAGRQALEAVSIPRPVA